MDRNRAALAAAFLISTICAAPDAAAQNGLAGGPYAPVILLLPGNARALAMGNTGVAGRDDPLFFNPAQLGVARGMSASAERYSSSSAGGSLSSAMAFAGGGIGVAMRMVDYEMPLDSFPGDRRRLLAPAPGAGTSVEAAVGIAHVIRGFRVGAAAKYAEDHVDAERVGRAAFDIGISKDLHRIYTIGLAVQNIGSSMAVPCSIAAAAADDDCPPPVVGTPAIARTTSVRLPLRTTLGAATSRPVGPLDLTATAAISLLRTNFVIPSGGAEVGYSWLSGYSIALRAGGRRPIPGEGGFTAGAGFTADRVSIDYALETLAGSRMGHRVGIRIR